MKTFLNTICVIVLMLAPLAFNSNLKKKHMSKIATSQIDDKCLYYTIQANEWDMCIKRVTENSVRYVECTESDDFLWRIEKNNDDTYTIYSKVDNKVWTPLSNLSPGDSITLNSIQVTKFFKIYNDLEKFNIVTNNGLTYFKNNKSTYCVTYGLLHDAYNLVVQTNCQQKDQLFKLNCVIEKSSNFKPNANDCSNNWTQIVNRGNNMCVKFENIKNRVVQGTCGNGDEFLWRFEALDDGHFMIYSKKGNYVIDSHNVRTNNGNPVWNWDPHRGDSQRLEIKRSNPNPSFFNLIYKHSKRCLDVPRGSKQENIGLAQYDCIEGNANEEFRFKCPSVFIPNDSDCSNNWTQIVNRGNNMCVKFENIRNRVVQATCGNGDEFLWRLESLDDGHFMIYSKKGNYVIDSIGHGIQNGNPVYNWDPLRGDNQRLEIKKTNANPSFFNFIFKHSKLCLDVPNGFEEENLGLIQNNCLGNNPAGEFKFMCPKV